MLRILLSVSLFFLIDLNVYSQDNNTHRIDSLKKILFDSSRNQKLEVYLDLAKFYYSEQEYKTALEYAEKAIELAENQNLLNEKADAYYQKARIYYQLNKFREAVNLFEKSANDRLQLEDKKGALSSLNGLGVTYSRLGEYEPAIKYYLKSLEIATELESEKHIAALNNNIGIIYKNLNRSSESIPYFQNALALFEKNKDEKNVGKTLQNLANLFVDIKSYDRALDYALRSLKINERLKNNLIIAGIYNTIGLIYQNLKDFKKAEEYFRKSIALKEDLNDTDGIVAALTNLASLKNNQSKYDEAMVLLQKALKISKKLDLKFNIQHCYKGIAIAYAGLKDYKNAYKYQNLYIQLNEENFNSKTSEEINRLKSKYEYEQQQNEIKYLEQHSKLREAQYQTNLTILILVLVVLALITLIFYFLYYKSNIKRKLEQDRMESELRFKTDFTAMLVHDIRNPLYVIMGQSELLTICSNDQKVQKIYHAITHASKRILDLINDMLEISKFEAGKMKLRKNKLVLNPIIYQAIELTMPLASKKSIKVDYADSELPSTLIDEKRIEQVLINLLSNAIKFSPSDSEIKIQSKYIMNNSKSFIQVDVIDQGDGIQEETMPHLFDKYAQFQNQQNSFFKGTGLGLAVSKMIIEAHNGTIKYKKEERGGSNFYFQLPVV